MPTPKRLAAALAVSLCLYAASLHADQWTPPTPAELSMTSIPEVPNAPAVYLYKSQTTEDSLHMFSYYVRLKVLNERGKEYANVELNYLAGSTGSSIDDISGRTIHPDGTIVQFTGKPYEKLVAKANGYKEKAKVFTMPAVEVGSILEYRYKLHFDDQYYMSPEWSIQSDIFLRKAHYMWKPTDRTLINEKGENVSGRVAWAPILPEGAAVKATVLPSGKLEIDLDVHDIPPTPHEEYMPPVASLSYRVLFYYTATRTSAEFWKDEGKSWSKARDKFIGPNDQVRTFVSATVAPGDSDQQKATKLYAALMTFENTDFTREHSSREDKADGLKNVANAGDVIARKRGSGDQLAEAYVAMARAAGIKAYVASVSNRDQHFFLPMYLSLRQVDDSLAILNIDGKDVFYDPGQRFCEPGHLAWKHALAGGIRQADGGAILFTTPAEPFKFASVGRVADLTLDEHGEATGTVRMTYTGDPALYWRHEALRGDDTGLNADLRNQMEQMLPGGMEVRVTNVENLADYTKPLKVEYEVKGPVGSSAGKRLLVPADVFVANNKPKFTSSTREIAIDMHYSSDYRDAVRFKLPDTLVVESVPAPDKALIQELGAYETFSRRTPKSVTTFRNVTMASPLYGPKEYSELLGFFTKLETKDQETLILTRAVATTSATPANASPAPANSGGPSVAAARPSVN